MTALAAKPSHIEWQKYRFLIMDAPKSTNLHLYLRECKKHNVTDIVRVCEPTYDAAEVEAAGIAMHVRLRRAGRGRCTRADECCAQEMRFDDGDSPPDEVIDMWLALVNQRFANAKADDPNGPCIAVHCVAGLGRCVRTSWHCAVCRGSSVSHLSVFCVRDSAFAWVVLSRLAELQCWSQSR